MLGGLQVSVNGDLANWIIPGSMVKGMGGAMDLVASGSKVVVLMEHNTKKGEPRLLEACTYPRTGRRIVDLLITDLGVFTFDYKGVTLREIAKETTIDEVKMLTGCHLNIADDVK